MEQYVLLYKLLNSTLGVTGQINVLASSSPRKGLQLPFEWGASELQVLSELIYNEIKSNRRWLLVTLALAGQSCDRSRSGYVLDRAVPLYLYRSCAQICVASYVINTGTKMIVLVVMAVVTKL